MSDYVDAGFPLEQLRSSQVPRSFAATGYPT